MRIIYGRSEIRYRALRLHLIMRGGACVPCESRYTKIYACKTIASSSPYAKIGAVEFRRFAKIGGGMSVGGAA